MHLAVAGGCTLDAAEAVSGTTVGRLSSLIDHNLLRQGSTATGSRYSMLETIRESALELLEGTQRLEAARAAHAAYYLVLAKQLEPDLERGQHSALDRIDEELDNVRAAFAWAKAADGELALRLAARCGFDHRPYADEPPGTASLGLWLSMGRGRTGHGTRSVPPPDGP